MLPRTPLTGRVRVARTALGCSAGKGWRLTRRSAPNYRARAEVVRLAPCQRARHAGLVSGQVAPSSSVLASAGAKGRAGGAARLAPRPGIGQGLLTRLVDLLGGHEDDGLAVGAA